MKRLGAILLLSAAALGQTRSGIKTVWYADGTGLEIHSESTGRNLPLSTSGTDTVTAGCDYHRLVLSNDGSEARVLLGYDIEARKTGSGTFRVRIKPTDTTKVGIGGGGKWLPIPTIAAIREFPPLRTGDAVEVDILSNTATSERIFDVLRIASPRPSAAPKPAGERFSLMAPRVVAGGATIREPREVWMQGGAIGVDLPGRGWFYFSLTHVPNLPVDTAGWVERAVLRFYAGAELVEIFAKRNVLETAEFATLWVYRDPDTGPRAAAIARLQQELAAVRKTYRPEHPDVKALEQRLLRASGPVEFICGDDVESLMREKGPWD